MTNTILSPTILRPSLAERLEEPGDFSAQRDRFSPASGTASMDDAFPPLAPELVVEVLGSGNTKAEMSRKRIEYFHSGTQLIWIVDCDNRSVTVYTSPGAAVLYLEKDTIDGGCVLPGFSSPVAEFFVDLDLGKAS